MVFPSYERMEKLLKRDVHLDFIREIAENPAPYCLHLTQRINQLFQKPGNHPVYLRNLLWLAGHLRILAAGSYPSLEPVARAIDYFLKGREDKPEFSSDLRWLCLVAIRTMVADFGPSIRKRYISDEEQERVDELWLKCFPTTTDEDGIEELKRGAEEYARRLEKLSNEIHLPDISAKIRFLIEHCNGSNESSLWARAALKYLLLERDTLPDNWGYLGLLDDMTVVEKTCEMIDESAFWQPLLEHFLERWPFLREISFAEESRLERLSAFLKVAGGITLDRLAHPESQSCLVVSERGPLALLSALFIHLSLQSDQHGLWQNPPELKVGDDVQLWSQDHSVRARFAGFDGNGNMRLKLSTSRRGGPNPDLDIWLMPLYFEFLQKAEHPHSSLSIHNDYIEWKKKVQPDLIAALLGHRIQPLKSPPLLLVMQRQKLSETLENCLPMGQSLKKLLGITYITRHGKCESWGCGRFNCPQLLVCSEPLIAREILEGRLETGFDEPPHYLLVDGPTLLPDDRYRWRTKPATLVFAEVAEREAVCELQKNQFTVDYLTAEDTMWRHEPVGKFEGEPNYLISYMWRQHVAPHVFHHTETIERPVLENLHHCLDRIITKPEENQDLLETASEVFVFLKRAEKNLLFSNAKEDNGLIESLNKILEKVGATRHFHTLLQELWEKLKLLKLALPDKPFDREHALSNRLQKLLRDGKSVGVLLPKRLKARFKTLSWVKTKEFWIMTPRELDNARPLDTLIVPYWPGRVMMRRLQNSGFGAECIYIFFSHEQRWLNNIRKADNRYRTKLRSDLQKQWELWQQSYQLPDLKQMDPPDDLEQDAVNLAAEVEKDDNEESPDFNVLLEKLTKGQMNRLISQENEKTIKAHPVIFESPLFFYFAAPKSRTLCVNDLLESNQNVHASSKPKYLRPFDKIGVGDVLAFPMEDREDVIDDLADRFLQDHNKIRQAASIWRTALRTCFEACRRDLNEFQQHLAFHGLKREIQTLRLWLGKGHMVAPRGLEVLDLIAQITKHGEMNTHLEKIKAAIYSIYKARREACKHFLRQIKDVDFELDQDIVEIKIAGKKFHFRVLQVAEIMPRKDISYNLVGRLQYGQQILKGEDQRTFSEEDEDE